MQVTLRRGRPGFGWIEAVALALFCGVLASVIPFHEPWSDEAQAWLIARDSSLRHIFFHQLHYEGTPGLWHLLLWVATRLHLPYASMQYISSALVAAAVYVMLRYSPFPRAIRILIPFCFYLQYQFSVVSRSYALFPLSVFLLCVLYTRKEPAPMWFAVVAGLTANESMHGWLFAFGISIAYVLKLRERAKAGEQAQVSERKLLAASGVLGAFLLFAFYTALPAPDIGFAFTGVGATKHTTKLQSWLTGIPAPPPATESEVYAPAKQVQALPPEHSHAAEGVLKRVRLGVGFFTYPYSKFAPLAWTFTVLAVAFAFARGEKKALIPLILLTAGMILIDSQDHHAGLHPVAFLGVLWLVQFGVTESSPARVTGLELALYSVLGLILLLQVQWSAHAVLTDIRTPYDPGLQTAAFLKKFAKDKTVYSFFYDTTSEEPYFQRKLFANRPTAYWEWSGGQWRDGGTPTPQEILQAKPSYIVFPTYQKGPDAFDIKTVMVGTPWVPMTSPELWLRAHYRETHRFCGLELARNGYATDRCHIIFEP